jgi:hypothetical protein
MGHAHLLTRETGPATAVSAGSPPSVLGLRPVALDDAVTMHGAADDRSPSACGRGGGPPRRAPPPWRSRFRNGLTAPVAISVALVAISITACRRERGAAERDADPRLVALVEIDSARLNLRQDQIGHGPWAQAASFVLVDAENTHTEDLMVTLAGNLVDGSGQVVGTLRPASLRIPAGGVRTFALVDSEQAVRPHAASARVEGVGAHVPAYAPPVVVTDGHVYRDGDRVVVTGQVRNTAEQGVRVIVLGGFHDAAGMPLTRPFVDMYVAGGASHPVELVGPPGSVSGYAFIGELAY